MNVDDLRVLVGAVDREVANLPRGTGDVEAVQRLVTSWRRLVAFLDLGPARELRDCPHCGAIGMSTATRCAACWTRLSPTARA